MVDRRTLLGVLAMTLAPSPLLAASQFGPSGGDDADLAGLLGRYVRVSKDRVNRVDYRAWRDNWADRRALSDYVRTMGRTRPQTLSRDEQIAYWANLYNAETLRVVLGAYPVRSIMSIRPTLASVGPWKAKTLSVAGADLSLDDIENRILRPVFRDPMIHYALNCASLSCPSLQVQTWRGATLRGDLERAARAYVNHPRGVRVTSRGLVLSSIYKWYRADFGGDDASVLAHLARFADAPLHDVLDKGPRIARYAYDWDLNDVSAG
jgi:hypothetical protein